MLNSASMDPFIRHFIRTDRPDHRSMQDQPKIIAIIDDEPLMLEAIERLLGAYGLITRVFASAEEFLRGDAGAGVSCLVLDINLGGMSGIDLSRRLKAAGSQLPIIFMTAADEEVIQREAMTAGCVAYLSKPFPAHHLIDAICKAIGRVVDLKGRVGPS